ncbi:MAG: hypothetical protein ABIN58_03470 [candidate division WOR-3 bacterium]
MKKSMTHYKLKLTCTSLLLALFVGGNVYFQSAAQRTRFLYVFDAGDTEFIKVDLASQRVVDHRDLARDMRAAELLDNYMRWYGPLIHGMLYNPNNGSLYVETQAGTAHDETGDIVVRMRVLGFKLPSFEFIGAIHENDPVTTMPMFFPSLIPSQDWERLLYFYGKQESGKRPMVIFETYSAETLKLIEQRQREMSEWNEVGPEARQTYLEQMAKPGIGKKFKIEQSAPLSLSGDETKGSFKLERVLAERPPSFRIFYVNREVKRVVLWESKTRERIRRYKGKKDGKEQEIEEKSQVESSTGRFIVYDQLGKKLFELNDNNLAGESPEIRTISTDGRTLYFAPGHDRLYAIDLTEKKPPVKIKTYGIDVKSAIYLFADR